MDLIFLITTFLLAIMCPLVITLIVSRRKLDGNNNPPPGSFGLPLIGETIQFLSAMRRGRVEEFIHSRTQKYSSPVFKTSVFGEKLVIFPGQAGNKFIFTNESELFTSWIPTPMKKLFPSLGMVNIHLDKQRARKQINFFFRAEAVHNFVSSVDFLSRQHLNKYWNGKDEVRVYELTKLYSFTLACRSFIGIEDETLVSLLLHHFNFLIKGLMSIPFYIPGTPFYQAAKAANELRKEISKIIKQRKAQLRSRIPSQETGELPPVQDLLSYILTAIDPMTDLEIGDAILAYLIGAHETTTATISFTLKYLAEKPEFYQHVLKEQEEIREIIQPRETVCWDDIQRMKCTWNFACEAMRIIPTIQGSFRETKTDITFQGYFIPKGWKVYWSSGVTHKNEDHFPEPEKFNPARFEGNVRQPYTYIPFGSGPHMCPGREYARLTILIFLHHVMKTFTWETLIPNEKIIYASVPSPVQGLPVRLFPR